MRNKKIVSKIFYFMVEKFEIKVRFLIQARMRISFRSARTNIRDSNLRFFIVVRNIKNHVQMIYFMAFNYEIYVSRQAFFYKKKNFTC